MLLTEVAQHLHNSGIGVFDETGVTGNIFIGTIPSSPDLAMALYPTGGGKADNWNDYDKPTIQILVRGTTDPRTGMELAENVYNRLKVFCQDSFIPNGVWVLSCIPMQSGVTEIGKDDNGRYEFSLNFELEIKNN